MCVRVTVCARGGMVMSVLGARGPRGTELRSHLSVLSGAGSPFSDAAVVGAMACG